MSVNPLVSIVIPCYNEEEVIERTHLELSNSLKDLPYNFEFIFVDDGSKDKTVLELAKIHQKDSRAKMVIFSRNFGHQFAVTAGIEAASGEAVILIDADLQDPPQVIVGMLDKWKEGFEVVYGVRTKRDGETAFKRFTAKWFYRTLNRLSETEIPLDTGDFRLMDRKVVNSLLQLKERDRFIRGMVSWVGYKQTPIYYERAQRFAGTSKYPLWKMLKFAIDGILSFSITPLRFATYLGFFTSIIALVGIVYALIMKIFFSDSVVKGWALSYISLLFLGGIQLICTGIIGEYLGRVYGEIKNRPLYIVREKVGFNDNSL
jgi:polyisoprenyl-phosphate glycosyltransferase